VSANRIHTAVFAEKRLRSVSLVFYFSRLVLYIVAGEENQSQGEGGKGEISFSFWDTQRGDEL